MRRIKMTGDFRTELICKSYGEEAKLPTEGILYSQNFDEEGRTNKLKVRTSKMDEELRLTLPVSSRVFSQTLYFSGEESVSCIYDYGEGEIEAINIPVELYEPARFEQLEAERQSNIPIDDKEFFRINLAVAQTPEETFLWSHYQEPYPITPKSEEFRLKVEKWKAGQSNVPATVVSPTDLSSSPEASSSKRAYDSELNQGEPKKQDVKLTPTVDFIKPAHDVLMTPEPKRKQRPMNTPILSPGTQHHETDAEQDK